jgi:HAD superfamily hydrolase (TIGR01509 family)
MKTQVVILDCDGVMFDTTSANKAFYNQILAHFGLPPMSGEQFDFAHMHTVFESIDFLFEGQPRLVEAAHAYRQNLSYLTFVEMMRIEPDLKALLKAIRPHKKAAVATNRTDTMPAVLSTHGLEGLFDMVVTALDVERPKPAPDELEKILVHFDLAPSQALYVGDSAVDQQAAAAAQIPFVAFGNRSLSAQLHIERLGQLQSHLV